MAGAAEFTSFLAQRFAEWQRQATRELATGRTAEALQRYGAPEEVLDRPPTPAVARFLGFTGELLDGDHVVMARRGQVSLDPAGPYAGRIERRIPIEDGVRLEVTLPGGRLECAAGRDAPEAGATVRLRIDGGVRFPSP